jgi:hypothetical protein
LEGARGEPEQLTEQTDVLVAARARATTVSSQAPAGSTRLLANADDHVDCRRAELDVVLGQVSSQVNNTRLRLTARRGADLARFQELSQAVAGEDDLLPDAPAQCVARCDPEVVERRGPATADVSR